MNDPPQDSTRAYDRPPHKAPARNNSIPHVHNRAASQGQDNDKGKEMEVKDKPKLNVLMVHETIWHSAVKDLVSAGVLLGMVGIGIWADSGALQWCAGVIWILWVFSKSASYTKNNAYTFDDARKKLDEWEAK